MYIKSLKHLARELQKLKGFVKPKIKLEQYETNIDVGSELLWNAHMIGDLEDARIADLGCGTGILGIGCMFLGAGHMEFVDKDGDALEILKKNLEEWESEGYDIVLSDIEEYNGSADLVIMNPPFGTKDKHADKRFLEKAFKVAPVVYSLHKTSTKGFVRAICKDHNYEITQEWNFSYLLKKTADFHQKKVHTIEVSGFRMEKKEK